MFAELTVSGIWTAVTSFAGITGIGTMIVAVVAYSVFRRVTRWGVRKM